MRFKLSTQFIVGILIVGTLIAPGVSLAEREERGERTEASAVCGRIDGVSREILRTLSERGTSFEEEDHEQRGHIENERTSLDSLRSKNRIQGNTNTERQFKVLESFATTDESRAAVSEFQAAVSAALAARRLAFDRALAEYRAGLDKALSERTARIDAARTAMRRDVEGELAKMKSACGAGTATSETRASFITALRAIQERFRTEQRSIEKLSGSLNDLIEQKQEAINQADATLKAALATARSTFEARFDR